MNHRGDLFVRNTILALYIQNMWSINYGLARNLLTLYNVTLKVRVEASSRGFILLPPAGYFRIRAGYDVAEPIVFFIYSLC